MGANSFGMAITIGIQLASLPLFLHYWDAASYGVWLMLSAIPSYLSMADVGMVTAAGNKMTMATGKGDIAEANRVFQSAQLFMAIVCGSLAVVVVPLVLWAPLPGIETTNQRVALAAMSFSVLLSLFGGLSEATFKATERYATGTMLGNYARLGEWSGSMLGLILAGSFSAVALSALTMKLIGVIAGMLMASKGNHGLKWGFHAADRAEIHTMVKPAVSFMAFPLANALSLQGVTLIVGALFGPVSVAIFNTYRTIARLAVQVTAILSHAVWPEFSRLYGQGAMSALQNLYRRTSLLAAGQAILLSLIIYFVSPLLLRLWTHGAIAFIPSLMLWMLLYAAVAGTWHIPRVLLMSTNQHISLAYWSLASGVLIVGLAWIMGHTFNLNGVAISMLIGELAIAIVCGWLAFVAVKHDREVIPQ